jgi:hypothetical protein
MASLLSRIQLSESFRMAEQSEGTLSERRTLSLEIEGRPGFRVLRVLYGSKVFLRASVVKIPNPRSSAQIRGKLSFSPCSSVSSVVQDFGFFPISVIRVNQW